MLECTSWRVGQYKSAVGPSKALWGGVESSILWFMTLLYIKGSEHGGSIPVAVVA